MPSQPEDHFSQGQGLVVLSLAVLGLMAFQCSSYRKDLRGGDVRLVAGLPRQQIPGQTVHWKVPTELEYPYWVQMYEGNSRIYRSTDSLEVVDKHYRARLPEATRIVVHGGRCTFKTDAVKIDLEGDGSFTKIVFSPIP